MTSEDKTQNRRRRIAVGLAALLLLLLAGGVVFYFWQESRLELVRREYAVPQVTVQHPFQGEQLPASQYSYVSTQAGSRNPIRSMELWVDGQLIEVLESGLEEGTLQMGRTFDLLVGSGSHTLVVRAIDTQGQIGQSLPVSYNGIERSNKQDLYYAVNYDPEMSLDLTGEEYQVDPGEIIALNPEVFGEGNPEGGELLIPISSSQQEEVDDASLSGAAADASSISQASGKICYPSQQIPAMTAFFQNTQTKAVIPLAIAAKQTQYSISLTPGTYTAYAWLPDNSLGGSYSKAVPCGLDVSCTDHTPLPFTVQSGQSTQDIDICDWYSPSDVPAPPPSAAGPPTPQQPQAQIPANTPMLEVAELLPAGNASSLPWAFFLPNMLPAAPTNLKASPKDCQVQLSWDSDPQGLSDYQVWYSSLNGSITLQATLKAPPSSQTSHWYAFTPSTSGQITVWVEALNAIGSQASNPVVVNLQESCKTASPGNLEFRTLDVKASPGYDRVYTYLSLEGLPEQRIPADDSEFIRPEGERSNTNRNAPAFQKFILSIPQDDSLTIQGECWGWSGGSLSLLSQFEDSISSSQWDGSPGQLGDEKCQISYQIQSTSISGSSLETYGGNNLIIPPPYNVRVDRTKYASDDANATPYEQYSWWWEREVKWQWKGDIKAISGFTIYLNGSAVKTVAANLRSAYVTLPANCGPGNKWEVTANGKEGTTPKSQPYSEITPQCGKYIKIFFQTATFVYTCDDFFCPYGKSQCDNLEGYFSLSVNNWVRQFYGGNIFIPINCGKHKIEDMVYSPEQAIFVLPYYGSGYIDLYVKAEFYDWDMIDSDDYLGPTSFHLSWPSFSYGEQYIDMYGFPSTQGPKVQFKTGDHISWDSQTRMVFDLWLFPNKVAKQP